MTTNCLTHRYFHMSQYSHILDSRHVLIDLTGLSQFTLRYLLLDLQTKLFLLVRNFCLN